MITTYTYDVATDIPIGRINPEKLRMEILLSSITTALIDVATENGSVVHNLIVGGTLRVTFEDALTASEKTTLDGDATNPSGGLIGAHAGRLGLEFGLESRLGYQVLSLSVLNEIQYTKVTLPPGFYSSMSMWQVSAGLLGFSVKIGIYSDSARGGPNSLLESGSASFTSSTNNSLITIPLDSSFDVSTTTTYWLAVIINNDLAQFASTDNLVSSFHPVRFETRLTHSLPATANPNASDTGTALFLVING